MKTIIAKAHFVENYLLNPTNPIVVNLIGAGGTGSHVLTRLAVINQSLTTLGHAGLFVRVFDDDVVTEANKGRQPFAEAELGLQKAVALINRINRFFGIGWKAVPRKFTERLIQQNPSLAQASITISCVDNVASRFEIAGILKSFQPEKSISLNRPLYWMDFGNSRYTGQVLLSTVSAIKQPTSKKFMPVASLPFITEEFKDLLSSVIEKGLSAKDDDKSGLLEIVPKDSLKELAELATECLQKAGLTELSEKLKGLNSK